jgi:hypothetical protein
LKYKVFLSSSTVVVLVKKIPLAYYSYLIMPSFNNTWKNYLLSNPELLDISNNYLSKIKELADPNSDFEEGFEIISKNPSISFISLDPSGSVIQLFHHCQVIGGS